MDNELHVLTNTAFVYGAECPQKECNESCRFSHICEAISKLVDEGHAPKCACKILFEEVNCSCGKVNQL